MIFGFLRWREVPVVWKLLDSSTLKCKCMHRGAPASPKIICWAASVSLMFVRRRLKRADASTKQRLETTDSPLWGASRRTPSVSLVSPCSQTAAPAELWSCQLLRLPPPLPGWSATANAAVTIKHQPGFDLLVKTRHLEVKYRLKTRAGSLSGVVLKPDKDVRFSVSRLDFYPP